MNKKILILIFLLFTGFAFAQTTVNLEDQCNCEVLSGTAVTAPGMITPAGADTGDVYVNTNTGTIYFWDGDSWELTATDDQQLQNFSFDAGTNLLSLDIEDGNAVTVDLSALNNAGSDDQDATEVNLNGPIDVDGDGNDETTVQEAIADLSAITETVTNLVDNNDGTVTYTNEDGTLQTINKSDVTDNLDGTYTFDNGDGAPITFVGTDDQDATEVILNGPIDVDGDGNDETTVQDAIADLAAITETVTNLVDNNDGTITYTNEDGTPQTISKSDLTDNGDSTYTFDNGDGVPITFVGTDDQNANEVNYDNTTSGLVATDVQAAIDEINAAAGTVALVDNLDGTYEFTDAAGNTTTITDTSISTMSAPVNGVYTYTDESGATQTIDTNANSNPYDNTTSGLVATDVQAAIDEINAAAGTVALVDNLDGTYEFTDAAGNTTTITDTSISTMSAPVNGVYTYTDESGATQTIDTNANSNPYDNTTSGLVATDVQAAIDEINAAAGTVALVDNLDGTYEFTDAAGNTTTITDTSISTMSAPVNGVYTYTDESGATQTIDTNANSNPYDNTTSGLVATDVQAAIDEINAAAGTVALVDNLDGTYEFTDAAGNTTTITDTSISTMSAPVNGVYTYTDESGATQTIDTNANSNPYDNTTSGLVATDVQAAIDEINAAAGTVALVDNLDGTYEFTDAAGNTTTITDTSISTMSAPVNGVYTYTDESGATQTIDTNANSNPYDNTTSGLVATDVQAAIDEINAAAGTVALVDNLDGTYEFTDAAGNTTTITDTSISTMSAPVNGVYTYTDESGATQTIDTNANSNPYDNTTSGLVATDVQAAIDEINAAAGTVALVDNLDGTYEFTDAAGNTTTITDTSISTMSAPVNGVYTYTDESGATQTIDTNASSNPYDNTTSGLASTDVQAAIDEINAAAGTVALVDNLDGTYDFTDAAGNTTTITDTSISTMSAPVNGVYTYTDESGATQTIDTNANSNPYDNTASGLVATDVQAAIDEINAAAGTVALVDNLDGTYDFTDAAGNTTTITDTSISTMSAPVNGVYTYTDESGATQTIDTNANSNPYDNTTSGLVATDVQAAIDEINAAAGTVALVDNLDGTYEFTDAAGNTTTITDTSISTMSAPVNGVYTYTDESGATQTIDTNGLTITNVVVGNRIATITEPDGSFTDINETITAISDLGDGNVTFTNEAGGTTTVTKSYITDNGDGTYTFDNGNGTPITFVGTDDQGVDGLTMNAGELNISLENDGVAPATVDIISTDANNDIVAGTDGSLYLNVASVTIAETVTNLVDNNNGTITYTNEDGTPQTINKSDLTDNLDGTYTFDNGDGAPITFVGTDDQIANEVNITDAGGNFTATEVEGALAELAAGSTDDQLLDDPNTLFNAGTNELTIALEDGGTATADLSALDDAGTDDQIANEVNITDVGGNFTSTEVEGALAELAAGSTDDQLLDDPNTLFNAGTNELTIALEDGGTATADLSALDDAGTDDQIANEVNITDVGGNFTSTEVEGALAELAAGSTDDQLLDDPNTLFNAGTNELTIALEDGGTATADLSALDDAGTDDQIANEVNITDAGGNFTSTEVEGALAELAAGSTDDQLLDDPNTLFNAGTNELTIALEDGGTATADLSALDNAGTDDQTIDGLSMNAGELNISLEDDGVAPATVDMISTDANNDIVAGTDGSLYLNVASVTISETNTTLGFNGATNELTYTNELGNNPVLDLSSIDTDTDDQIANEVNITDAGGNFTATEVEGALAELAAGSTDDQLLDDPNTLFNAGTNELTIALEDGGTATADLSALDDAGTDDQIANEVNITDVGGNFTSTEVEGALAELAAGSTDDQLLDDPNTLFNAGTNELTIALEDGGTATADLSALDDAGTDDQIANEVNITDVGGNFTSTEVEGALAELAAGSTDDQLLDDPNTLFNAGTNELTIALEDGGTATADLSALDDAGTDDQIANEVNITDAGGNFTSTEVEGALAELAAGSTDDQTIDGLSLNAGILNMSLEDDGVVPVTVDMISTDANNDISAGTDGALYLNVASVTISETNTTLGFNGATNQLTYTNELGNNPVLDLSGINTDDQALSLAGNTLTLEDGGTVDLSGYVSTDDQIANEVNITDAGGNFTSTEVEGALAELAAGSTDDQALSLAGNTLTLEDGGTVDLSGYVSTDDQIANEVNITDAGGNFTSTEVEGALAELAAGSTDDQALSLAGNTLTLEDGGNVDLSAYLDDTDTDDQTLSLAGNTLSIADGNSVDLSGYVSTDDQIANEVNITDAGGNFTSTEVEGALAELAAGSTDDQALSLAGNTLTLEDGGTVDLSGYVSTDDQALSLAGNTLTLEDGGTVDLSGYVSTDDQIANEVNITDAGGNFTATEVEGALAELAAGSTDDQQLDDPGTVFNAGTNELTIALEDGGTATADLSALDNAGTDSQTLSTDNSPGDISITGGNNITLNVDDADAIIGNEVVNGTDATLTRSGTGTTGDPYTLDVSADGITNAEIADDAVQLENIADGTADGQVMQWDDATSSWTLVDLGSVTVTENDGVIGNEVTNATDGTLVRSGAGTTVSPYTLDVSADGITNTELADNAVQLENIADGAAADQIMQWDGTNWVLVDGSALSTDDQALSLAGNTLTLEDGGNVDLSAYLDDTDTDDQTLSLAGNTLSIADGNSVDLSGYVSTDDQIANEVNITDAGGNFTATEVEGALAELAAGSTDDQALSLAGNTLTLEDGGNVDLSAYLDDTDTDDQTLSLAGNTLSIADGNSVDLSGYVSTDDQIANEVNITDAGGNFTSTEVEGALAELAAGSTDDQALSLAGNTLTLEDGGNVDLSAYLDDTDTDDQTLSLAGNTLSIADGNSVDLSGYVSTDDQIANEVNITDAGGNFTATEVEGALAELAAGSTDDQALSLAGNTLTLEDGGNVDLSAYLDDTDTDDQTLSLAGNTLSIADGNSVDLSGYVSTDDQIANEVNITDAGGNFTATEVEGALAELAAGSTDDQALSLAGNTLTLEDGGNVDLSGYVSTDDQIANEVNITDAGGNFTATEVEGALAELAAGSTDDQALSLAGNTLTLEDGGNVDLSAIFG